MGGACIGESGCAERDIRALASLAFLESQCDFEGKRKDSLDLLMPLVLETLQCFNGISFTVHDFCQHLGAKTGLELPATVAAALLNRCKGSKTNPRYLIVEGGRYERTGVALECSNFVGLRDSINAQHAKLLEAIVEYAASIGLGELTSVEAGCALSDYLDRNFGSLSVGAMPPGDEPAAGHRWLGRFIFHLHDTGNPMFETIVTLVRGRVVFDAAFMPGFGTVSQRLKGLVVYLDSPALCRYMGFGTESDERLVTEAVRLLRSAGIVCRVLDETASEVGRIMGRVAANWGHPSEYEAPGSFLLTMPNRGRTRSEAQRAADSPVEFIEDYGFTVVNAPSRVRETVVDEAALAKRLAKKGWDFSSDNRIRHDINCIAAVMTQRGPTTANTLSKAKFLFLSDSSLTILNTRRWWQDDEGRSDIPPIFSIVDLANIAWLYGDSTDTKNLAMLTQNGYTPSPRHRKTPQRH